MSIVQEGVISRYVKILNGAGIIAEKAALGSESLWAWYNGISKEFKKDKKGNLEKVVTVQLESRVDEKTGRRMMVPVEGTEKELPCELVLIAAGFLGTQKYLTDAFGVEVNERTNIKTDVDKFATNVAGVFAAGDCHTGQSLVVKAIRQGRDCAREVDKYLMGYTNL
jgi:glutamate synthase (NADPH/NADH) small chain